ncbi:L-threonylcarbamoyladenylate synthase [Patescibacteria group bacterium]|nr:L-threonylcarbamoyladenylate synthase [Patescibacteria group bacterium]
MKVIKLTAKNFRETVVVAANCLSQASLVVIPTDTVYGLAVNALCQKGVEKLNSFKGRETGKGYSVFLNRFSKIKEYALFSKSEEKVMRALLPGPYTFVLRSTGRVAPLVESSERTVGIRLIEHEFINSLTALCLFPFTATSANVSDSRSFQSAKEFLVSLPVKEKKVIGLVVDGGVLPSRPPSAVIRLVGGKVCVVREGEEDKEVLLGRIKRGK